MPISSPRTLHLTLQRPLQIIDWNAQGPFLDGTIPCGETLTLVLPDAGLSPDYTAYGPLEDVLFAAAQVPCPDFGSDEADLEMYTSVPYFTCDRFPDTIDTAESFTRCRGDQMRCPSRLVRRKAQTVLAASADKKPASVNVPTVSP